MDNNQNDQNNQQPVSQVTSPVQNQPTPPAPISVPQREQGPAISASMPETTEFISPSEVEPILPDEVKEAGVETNPTPTVSQIAKELGVEQVKENTPVKTEPELLIKMPIPSGNAKQIASQHGRFRDSILWLAMLILRQIKIAKHKKSLEKKV